MFGSARRASLALALALLVGASGPGFAAAQPLDGPQRVDLDLEWSQPTYHPGETALLSIVMDIEDRWHIYAGVGSPDENDAYIATEIAVVAPRGWSVGAVQWPRAHLFSFGPEGFEEELFVYEGRAVAQVPVTIPAGAAPGSYTVTASVYYQACDDQICEPPVTIEKTATLQVVAAQGAPAPRVAERTGRVELDLAWERPAAAPGEPIGLAVVMDIESKWKIQAGAGSGDEVEPYLPTTINVTLPDGWETGPVQWPKATEFLFGFPGMEETLKVYEGLTIAYVPVFVPRDARARTIDVEVEVEYQACDPEICEMPTSARAQTRLSVLSAERAGEIGEPDAETAAVFADYIAVADGGARMADGEMSATTDPPPSALRDPPSAVSRPTFFGLTLPSAEGAVGLALLALFSALGGFILNLTPCVLPVIPIKVMTMLEHARRPGRNIILGLWMALGVVAFWVGIGLPVAFVAGITDPSQLFGIWWVTFGIGVLIALMGLGIMGLFAIQLPQSVYAVNPKADTAWGSFVFGIMTAVLGLPCFGFVAGALLAGAATLPPGTIMLIFTSLGVGMALPYLVLAMKPGLIEKIPRTGPASELVKQVMGLLLLAAASYFIGSGLIALVIERPYLARQLHWWAIAIFISLAALWLIVQTLRISSSASVRLTFTVAGLLAGGAATFFAMHTTNSAHENWLVRQAAEAEAGTAAYVFGYWNQWTPEAFEGARSDGHIVVLDFTAEWCANCIALKRAVLDRDPVRSELASRDVVKFTVDLTPRTAPGWTFLREELGQTGIPLLAIYTPGDDEPWMSNGYTSQQVLAALQQARTRRDSDGLWSEWSPEAVESARQAGRIIILNLTAEWDVWFAIFNRSVLDSDPVRSALESEDVAAFTVNLTSRHHPGWTLLRDELESTRMPGVLIYAPGDDEPWMSSANTAEEIMAAIEEARSRKGV